MWVVAWSYPRGFGSGSRTRRHTTEQMKFRRGESQLARKDSLAWRSNDIASVVDSAIRKAVADPVIGSYPPSQIMSAMCPIATFRSNVDPNWPTRLDDYGCGHVRHPRRSVQHVPQGWGWFTLSAPLQLGDVDPGLCGVFCSDCLLPSRPSRDGAYRAVIAASPPCSLFGT